MQAGSHTYFLAATGETYGDQALAGRLRETWQRMRVSETITRYDGASTWLGDDGKRILRVTRASLTPSRLVDVVDLDAVDFE